MTMQNDSHRFFPTPQSWSNPFRRIASIPHAPDEPIRPVPSRPTNRSNSMRFRLVSSFPNLADTARQLTSFPTLHLSSAPLCRRVTAFLLNSTSTTLHSPCHVMSRPTCQVILLPIPSPPT
jgi:hypothetical protein